MIFLVTFLLLFIWEPSWLTPPPLLNFSSSLSLRHSKALLSKNFHLVTDFYLYCHFFSLYLGPLMAHSCPPSLILFFCTVPNFYQTSSDLPVVLPPMPLCIKVQHLLLLLLCCFTCYSCGISSYLLLCPYPWTKPFLVLSFFPPGL